MEIYRNNVVEKLANLLRKANELPLLCNNLSSHLTTLKTSFENYETTRMQELEPELQLERIIEMALQNTPDVNLIPSMRQGLVDAAYEIVCIKTTVEIKLDEIISTGQNAHDHLLSFLMYYQSQHKFSHRSTKFTNILDEIIQIAVELVTVLSQMFAYISTHLISNLSVFTGFFEQMRTVIHEPGLGLNYFENFNDPQKLEVLLNQQSYQTNCLHYLNKLQEFEWSVYQNFTMVVDLQPPPVINTQRSRPISLRVFNLSLNPRNTISALQGHFPIRVYLVGEHTAESILRYNHIPENITSVTREQREGTDRTNNPISGKIFLKANAEENSSSSSRRSRARTTEDAVVNAPGYPVEYLEGEWDDSSNCYSFDRQLVVKDVLRKKADSEGGSSGTQNRRQSNSSTTSSSSNSQSDKSATEKYALLFVLDITYKNEEQKRKLWTLSLPFCVTTNSSQYEKAWGYMAWNEGASDQGGRFDFQVTDQTSWKKVKEMLSGTFECLVWEPLKDFHLKFLWKKTDELIFGGTNAIVDQTEITKANFLGSTNSQPQVISPWSWFFGSVSVVQANTHLHDIWSAGHIAGFVSYEDACNELANGLANNTADLGSFIIRFSDTCIGGLTFVFVSKEGERFIVTKFKPLETRQKRSKKECAEAVIKHLNERSKETGAEYFRAVHPFRNDNPVTDKRQVFEKFYNWSRNQDLDDWQRRGYVVG